MSPTHRSPEHSKRPAFEVSSGNVFADLKFPDADEMDLRVRLAVEVVRLINARRLTRAAAVTLLRINRPEFLALKNFKLDEFSAGRLMTFLLCLGQEVEICIRAHGTSKTRPRIHVARAHQR